jgi:hypothetical protein
MTISRDMTFDIAGSNKQSYTQSDWITVLGKHASGSAAGPEMPIVHAGKEYARELSGINGTSLVPIGKVTHEFVFITSIEGYNLSVIFTDSKKRKDETLNMSKRLYAEISNIREKYPLIIVMGDNSWENTSKELNDFFEAME